MALAYDSLTEYEQQRQRNIEKNRAMLAYLGLCDQRLPQSTCTKAMASRRVTKKTYMVSESRTASLRDRTPKEENILNSLPLGAMRSQAADREQSLRDQRRAARQSSSERKHNSSIQERRQTGKRATKQRLPTKPPAQRGGWNASSTYEGTAVVQGRGIQKRTIAIRKRIDNGRLYGYVGRVQLSWNPDVVSSFPCVVASQITVLEYTKGGKLPDAEGAK